MAKLPGGDRAIIDPRKLDGYVLDPSHRTGRHKARVFSAALGLTARDSTFLSDVLRRAAMEEEADLTRTDEYGAHFALEFGLQFGGRSATVRALWVVRVNEDFPRFVSAFVVDNADG